jgi:2-polyprenyl-6-methoxyphenol hydroxylase-like FAD-dependent oxidoreductase
MIGSHYHAVVFGIGPAACVFAIRTLGHGKSVLLVPPPRPCTPKPSGETLAPRGEFVLRQLGLAKDCLSDQHVTNSMWSCWRNSRLKRTDLAFDPHGRMWHLNRPLFDNALLDHAIALGADVIDSGWQGINGFERRPNGWNTHVVSQGSERALTAGYFVDATGKSASFARRMGAKRVVQYRLIALSCVCEGRSGVDSLLIEAVSKGWWYSFGLPHGKLVLTLMTDSQLGKVSKVTREKVWDELLDQACYTKERAGICAGVPSAVSVESARLDRMHGEGWVAVGDSAMTFDPLSSQGLTSAIEQAVEVADILSFEDENALAAFDSRRIELFEQYKTHRLQFYQSVQRFSEFEFWRNRLLD